MPIRGTLTAMSVDKIKELAELASELLTAAYLLSTALGHVSWLRGTKVGRICKTIALDLEQLRGANGK